MLDSDFSIEIELKSALYMEYKRTVSIRLCIINSLILVAALDASPAIALTHSEKCAALVDYLGGRQAVISMRVVKEEEFLRIGDDFMLAKDADEMRSDLARFRIHVQAVEADFKAWHKGSGIKAKLKFEEIEWKDNQGVVHHDEAPIIEFSLGRRPSWIPRSKAKHSTLLEPLLKHRLATSPGNTFVYHPLYLASLGAAASYTGILTGFKSKVYLGLRDLYEFDLLPLPLTHELTHLSKREQLARWQREQKSGFFVSGASISMNPVAADNFKNDYFQSGKAISVDESRAYLGTILASRKNLKKLIAETELPEEMMKNEFWDFTTAYDATYGINDELDQVLNLLRSGIERRENEISFSHHKFGPVDTMVVQHRSTESGASIRLYLPFNFDYYGDTELDVALFIDKMIANNATITDLPEVLRYDLINSLTEQSQYHEDVRIKLSNLNKSEEVRAWTKRFSL